jgi:hypothetical protein
MVVCAADACHQKRRSLLANMLGKPTKFKVRLGQVNPTR